MIYLTDQVEPIWYKGFPDSRARMIADSKELRDLCARVAKEQDPAKLRELIAELSLLLEAEEGEKSESASSENRSKKTRCNPNV